MTAEAPKPKEENQPRNRGFRPFDEPQVGYRSEPWHKNGGRFGYIDFEPKVLPDLYGSRHRAYETELEQKLVNAQEEALAEAMQLVQELKDSPQT